MIKLWKSNESKIFIEADYDQVTNINNHFSFYAPNYFYSPKFRSGVWDGKIYLFDFKTATLPIGLLSSLIKYFKHYKIKHQVDPDLNLKGRKLTSKSIIKFNKKIIKGTLTPRDYQIKGVQLSLYLKKCILLSATASGKSFILFLIINLLKYFNEDFKFLLIVPTTSLVEQMTTDFCEYGENFCDYNEHIHKIYSGKSKNTDKSITISTWQSLQRQPAKYFQQFECVICDEVHGASAKVLSGIMEKCINAEYKIGCSGTIRDTVMDKLQLMGLFGKVYRISTSTKLIKEGYNSDLKIVGIILKYPKKIRNYCKKMCYQDEIKFIRNDKKKMTTVCKLAISRKNNTLILFKSLEYGKLLYKLCKHNSKKKIYYVAGETETKTREKIRKLCEERNDLIIVASFGVFSTGVNIKNLHHLILAESMKSSIKVIQSIGRLLRKNDNKDYATLYDITEDLHWKKRKNYTLKHFLVRIGYYDTEKFNYIIKEVVIK